MKKKDDEAWKRNSCDQCSFQMFIKLVYLGLLELEYIANKNITYHDNSN